MTSGLQQVEEGQQQAWSPSCPYSAKIISENFNKKMWEFLCNLCEIYAGTYSAKNCMGQLNAVEAHCLLIANWLISEQQRSIRVK